MYSLMMHPNLSDALGDHISSDIHTYIHTYILHTYIHRKRTRTVCQLRRQAVEVLGF